MILDIVSTIVQALALVTAMAAIIANLLIHKKNRNVNTVIQLTKDFYQNNDFTRDRLNLWVKSKKLFETDFKFNYRQILESIQDNDETKIILIQNNNETKIKLEPSEIIALNRTVAFYHTIRVLIKRKEVDIDLLRDYFEYNYNRFYEPIRERLEADSDGGIDQNFLKKITELKSKEIPELKSKEIPELKIKDSDEQGRIFEILRLTQNWYRKLKSRIRRFFR